MRNDTSRLKRLLRLERLRGIARREAVREAGRAEGTLGELDKLVLRTRLLADNYIDRSDFTEAAAMQRAGAFVLRLSHLAEDAAREAATARIIADVRQQELASAERQRSAAARRADGERQAIARQQFRHDLGRRKSIGTDVA